MLSSRRISLVIDYRMCRFSGVGTYISSLVPILAEEFDITLLAKKEDIEAQLLTKVHLIEAFSKIYTVSEQIELFRKIPICDVFWSPHYNIPVLPVRARKRLVTIHDVYHLAAPKGSFNLIQKVYANIMLRCAIALSDKVLTVSKFSEKEIIRYCGMGERKIQVVSNAVRDDFAGGGKDVSAYGLPEKYILYVGNVKPHKNLITLLRAVEMIEGLNLVIVGKRDGFISGDPRVKELAENSEKLKNRVFFTGYINNEDLGVVYSAASLLVFPSTYESFGIPPLEAQVCGCPVVSSPLAGIKEIYGDSVLYCDPFSAEDIAAKILTVLTEPKMREQLVLKGFENVKKYSWKKSAMEIAQIIKSLKV